MHARLGKRPEASYNATDMNPNQPPQTPDFHNPLEVMSPGERVICEIKRHPFGMLGLYFGAALLIIVLGVGAALLPHYVTDLTTSARNLAYAIALFGSIFILLFTYVASLIYNGNRWIVTSDSITQISQVGLFKKQTSQLSLANLEDVTFEQNGLIPTMFGFGVLKVETAGERSKFSFPFCPNPDHCAREIIKAHEDFIQAHPEEGQTVPQGSFATAQAQPAAYQPPAPVAPAQPLPQAPVNPQPQDDNQGNNPTQQ